MHTSEKRFIGVDDYKKLDEIRKLLSRSSDRQVYKRLYNLSADSHKKLKTNWCMNVVFVQNEVVEI